MKACIIQPPYSLDINLADECFNKKLDYLDACDNSLDIIVLPEYSDVPVATHNLEDTLLLRDKYFDTLMNKCKETAKRCNSFLFVNALSKETTGYRNTTFAISREGEIIGKYFKSHLPPFEKNVLKLDDSYTYEYYEPYVLELEGIRFGFLTCYDFYFYEAYPSIAKQNIDVLIGCSLQRTDTHSTSEIFCRFLAYNTNSYVLRSSVSLGENSAVCGGSMAVSPQGTVLHNMKSEIGSMVVEFNPHDKFYKPAGFGNPNKAHFEYAEWGRAPWQYRNCGASVIQTEENLPYPRVCAHRGFNTIAPENTLVSLGAAVGMGADEIEFDIWVTTDGKLVSCHDSTLSRVSDGEGFIFEKTYDELLKLDFGYKSGEKFSGIRIATFEDILKKFASRVIMNIHIKIWELDNQPYDYLKEIADLIRKYDAQNHVYIMTSKDAMIEKIAREYPYLHTCLGWNGDEDPMSMVERAKRVNAKKIQLFKPYFNEETIKEAKKAGILCNVFYADDPEEAQKYLNWGADTILTNDYNLVSQVIKKR